MCFPSALNQRVVKTTWIKLYFLTGPGDWKPHNQALGGTLDAIRERMKSIQAGATGTVVTHSTKSSSNGSVSRTASSGEIVEDRALSGLQARMERLKAGGGPEY